MRLAAVEQRLDRSAAAALAIAALAFALRVNGLGAQSFWHDEGATLYYSLQPLTQLFNEVSALGEIPPLYYLLLHPWLALAGSTEFAARLPATMLGTVAVPLLYLLGRNLVDRPTGLLAALVLALSPLHVWQSQEARMYTLVVLLSALTLYLTLRSLDSPSRQLPLLLLLALTVTLGLYSHFTYALLLVALALALPLLALTGALPWPPVFRLALAAAAGSLPFLPWLNVGVGTYAGGATYWPGRLDVQEMLLSTLSTFAQGEHVALIPRPQAAALLALVAVCGLLLSLPLRRWGLRRGGAGLLLACLLLVPPLLLAWLLLDKPKFGPRYLLVMLPTLALTAGTAGSGLLRLWRRPSTNGRERSVLWLPALLGAVACAALLALNLGGLSRQQTDAALAREDFRGAATYLAATARPDDAIVLLGGHIQLPFNHYYQRAGGDLRSVFPLPDTLMPAVATPIQADNIGVLNEVTAGKRRVWVLRWQEQMADPAGMVLRQLELAGRRAEAGRAFHGLHLDLFELNGNPTFPITFQPSRPLAASFENGLSLLGYDLQPVAATTSDSLKLTLYWRVDRRVDANLIVFTQLLNRGNHIYAQHDKPPVSELYKTSQWAPGDLLRDEYLLPIKAGAPPGEYRLLMGLYDRDGMKRVPVSREGAALADHLPLTGLSLARGVGSAAYQPANPLALTLAEGVQLLGYEVEQQELHPGDTARIAFYWRAPATPGADYEVALALRDSQGNWHAQRTAPVVDGAYPSTAWQPGELVRDVQELALGAIPPGIYTLAAQLQASGTAPSALLDVGQLLIK